MDTKNSYTEKLEATVAKKKEELTAYEPYAPDEMFRFRGKDLFSVEDFWQYAYSQLDGMAETIAEVLVAKALGINKLCASLEQRDIPNTDLLDCTDKQQLLGEPGCRAEAVKAVRGICILPEYEQGYREAQCLDCG